MAGRCTIRPMGCASWRCRSDGQDLPFSWSPIDWAGCLEACVEAGASVFLELGPGSALARMAESVAGRPARSIEQFRTADGVRDWLARSLDAR